VRSQVEIEEAVEGTDVKEAELALASQVMDSLVGEFDPSELHSEYRQDLRAMLEAKLSGQEISKPAPPPETPVVDLMEALRRSVAEAQDRKTASGASKKRRAAKADGSKAGTSKARRTPARKSA
jgi:DNA end-binding protein Ku